MRDQAEAARLSVNWNLLEQIVVFGGLVAIFFIPWPWDLIALFGYVLFGWWRISTSLRGMRVSFVMVHEICALVAERHLEAAKAHDLREPDAPLTARQIVEDIAAEIRSLRPPPTRAETAEFLMLYRRLGRHS